MISHLIGIVDRHGPNGQPLQHESRVSRLGRRESIPAPRDTSYQTKDRNETEQKSKVAIQRDALLGCLAFWQRIHYV